MNNAATDFAAMRDGGTTYPSAVEIANLRQCRDDLAAALREVAGRDGLCTCDIAICLRHEVVLPTLAKWGLSDEEER
jgi:hypothetical protein